MQHVGGRGDVGLEAAVVGRALRGVRLGQQRGGVERAHREGARRASPGVGELEAVTCAAGERSMRQ